MQLNSNILILAFFWLAGTSARALPTVQAASWKAIRSINDYELIARAGETNQPQASGSGSGQRPPARSGSVNSSGGSSSGHATQGHSDEGSSLPLSSPSSQGHATEGSHRSMDTAETFALRPNAPIRDSGVKPLPALPPKGKFKAAVAAVTAFLPKKKNDKGPGTGGSGASNPASASSSGSNKRTRSLDVSDIRVRALDDAADIYARELEQQYQHQLENIYNVIARAFDEYED